MNNITIHGTVGQEPELRFSASNNAVLTFSVADNYGKDDKKKTTWHNVIVFGKVAENVANSISKGTSVLITGRYEQEEFTKKDGTKGKTTKLIADEVGVSCRWNAWVRDQTSDTVSQTGMIGKPMPLSNFTDEEPF
jgi:single-strand DNA-binding protein